MLKHTHVSWRSCITKKTGHRLDQKPPILRPNADTHRQLKRVFLVVSRQGQCQGRQQLEQAQEKHAGVGSERLPKPHCLPRAGWVHSSWYSTVACYLSLSRQDSIHLNPLSDFQMSLTLANIRAFKVAIRCILESKLSSFWRINFFIPLCRLRVGWWDA